MPPTGPAYDLDWVLASSANAHVATDRAWFTTYTEFASAINEDLGGGGGAPVLGVGTVELPLKCRPDRPGSKTFTLHNVLHVPSVFCNVICASTLDTDYKFGYFGGPIVHVKTGAVVGFLERPRLTKVRLKGQAPNSTSLEEGVPGVALAVWMDDERARWEAYRETGVMRQALEGGGVLNEFYTDQAGNSLLLYTDEEREWLRGKYGGEFRFLRAQGLNIYRDGDRLEGRRICRGLMKEDGESER